MDVTSSVIEPLSLYSLGEIRLFSISPGQS